MELNTVLVIAYYFPPLGLSGVQRTLKFVKYLPNFGWKPIVLTTTPESYYAFDNTLLNDIDLNIVDIYRTAGKKHISPKSVKFPSYFKQKIGRYLLQLLYQPDRQIPWKKIAVKLGTEIMKKHNINVIYSTAPPFTDFLIANELSAMFKKPFAVDYRDVWVDNPYNYFPTGFHKNYCINLEKNILTNTKKIFVTTRIAKETILKRYRFLSHNDIFILPHGYDEDDFKEFRNITKAKDKFIITFSGLFQDDSTPKYFLEALRLFIRSYPEARNLLEVRFVGVMRDSHLKLINKMELSNYVIATGYVKHSDSVRYLMESDVLWLTMNNTIRTLGKLYEYIGARKPIIISAPDGNMRKAALDTGAAIATEFDDVEAIKKAISEFYHLWKNDKLPVPDEDYARQFTRELITGELARELTIIADL